MRILTVLLMLTLVPVNAFALEGTKVMALSPSDNRAVILPVEGKLAVVKSGDAIDNGAFNVVQVLSDKLVLRDAGNGDMIWLLKSVDQQPAEIKRFSGELDKSQLQRLWDSITEEFE